MRPAALALALSSLLCAGCAARADRFHASRRDGARAALPTAQPGERGGFARFGPGVHVRDDTPPLSDVLAATRAPEAPREEPAWGPRGEAGEAYATSGPAPCAGGCPPGAYPYGYPVGSVPPGLRPPWDVAPPASPFAAALGALPGSDAYDHRPGLSTGSGVFARGR